MLNYRIAKIFPLILGLTLIFTGCFGTNEDPTEEEARYNVSGQILDENENGLEDVSIKVSGNDIENSTVDTDSEGKWSASSLIGSVQLTPSKSGWSFNPESKTVNSRKTGIEFVAFLEELAISAAPTGNDSLEITFSHSFESVDTGGYHGDLMPEFTFPDGNIYYLEFFGKHGWPHFYFLEEPSGNSVEIAFDYDDGTYYVNLYDVDPWDGDNDEEVEPVASDTVYFDWSELSKMWIVETNIKDDFITIGFHTGDDWWDNNSEPVSDLKHSDFMLFQTENQLPVTIAQNDFTYLDDGVYKIDIHQDVFMVRIHPSSYTPAWQWIY